MADSEDTPVSPVGANRPEISVSAAAINHEPVELDSTPTTPEELRKRRGSQEVVSAEEKEVRCSHWSGQGGGGKGRCADEAL